MPGTRAGPCGWARRNNWKEEIFRLQDLINHTFTIFKITGITVTNYSLFLTELYKFVNRHLEYGSDCNNSFYLQTFFLKDASS